MSGGHFEYKDSDLKYEIFGWSDKATNKFEDIDISELVWDILELLHDYDWYVSGDTGEEDWLKEKSAFKKKWFKSSRKDRIKSIVDSEIDKVRSEIYKTFDLNST